MHPKTLRVHPQQALAVYAESLASGSTFALFGDSSLGLAEQLVELGASSVQVWDPDARRAGAEAERSSDAITVRGYDASGPRTRSVNLAIIADLGLIAAAQRVEHYEISGYGTARSLARQIGERDVATLLAHTLGEEQSSDYLLTELTKPLMQQANSGEATENGRPVGAKKQKA